MIRKFLCWLHGTHHPMPRSAYYLHENRYREGRWCLNCRQWSML